MSSTEGKGGKEDGTAGFRWTNALLVIATIAAVSGVIALLIQRETAPGVQVSLPAPTPAPRLMAYVSGAVAQPGVYEFREGDRLEDAVEIAGGLLPDADASAVNMASLLEDERHYHFPVVGESRADASSVNGAESETVADPSEPSAGNSVDINAASIEQLRMLPGIGVVKAEAIVEFRNTYGLFSEASEIISVPGIGPAIYENLRHLITANPSAP